MDYYKELLASYDAIKKRKYKPLISEEALPSLGPNNPQLDPDVSVRLNNLAARIFTYEFLNTDGTLKTEKLNIILARTKEWKTIQEDQSVFEHHSWSTWLEQFSDQLLFTEVVIPDFDGKFKSRTLDIQEQLLLIDTIENLGHICWEVLSKEDLELLTLDKIALIKSSVYIQRGRGPVLIGHGIPFDNCITGFGLDPFAYLNNKPFSLHWLRLLLSRVNNMYKGQTGEDLVKMSDKNPVSFLGKYDTGELLRAQFEEDSATVFSTASILSSGNRELAQAVLGKQKNLFQEKLANLQMTLDLASKGRVFVNDDLMQKHECKDPALYNSINQETVGLHNTLAANLKYNFGLAVKKRYGGRINRNLEFYYQDPILFQEAISFLTQTIGDTPKVESTDKIPLSMEGFNGAYQVIPAKLDFKWLPSETHTCMGFNRSLLAQLSNAKEEDFFVSTREGNFDGLTIFKKCFQEISSGWTQAHFNVIKNVRTFAELINIFFNSQGDTKELGYGIKQIKALVNSEDYQTYSTFFIKIEEIERSLFDKEIPLSTKIFIRNMCDNLIAVFLENLSKNYKSREVLAAILYYLFSDYSNILYIKSDTTSGKVYISSRDKLLKPIFQGVAGGLFTVHRQGTGLCIKDSMNKEVANIFIHRGVTQGFLSNEYIFNTSIELEGFQEEKNNQELLQASKKFLSSVANISSSK